MAAGYCILHLPLEVKLRISGREKFAFPFPRRGTAISKVALAATCFFSAVLLFSFAAPAGERSGASSGRVYHEAAKITSLASISITEIRPGLHSAPLPNGHVSFAPGDVGGEPHLDIKPDTTQFPQADRSRAGDSLVVLRPSFEGDEEEARQQRAPTHEPSVCLDIQPEGKPFPLVERSNEDDPPPGLRPSLDSNRDADADTVGGATP